MKFEYTYKNYSHKSISEIMKDLNEMGNKGWELISCPRIKNNGVIPSFTDNEIFIFKKEINEIEIKKI